MKRLAQVSRRIEIAEIAQVKVVVVQPGAGDDIQAMKAGVLEIADVLVVNKSDLPDADHCISDLRQMIESANKVRWPGTHHQDPML